MLYWLRMLGKSTPSAPSVAPMTMNAKNERANCNRTVVDSALAATPLSEVCSPLLTHYHRMSICSLQKLQHRPVELSRSLHVHHVRRTGDHHPVSTCDAGLQSFCSIQYSRYLVLA